MKNLFSGFLLGALALLLVAATANVPIDPVTTQYGFISQGSFIGGNYTGSPYTNTGTANTPTKWLSTNNVPNEPAPNGSFATSTTGQMFIRTNDTWVAINAGSAGGGSGIPTLDGKGTNTQFWVSSGGDKLVYDTASGFIYSFTAFGVISIDTDGRELKDSSGNNSVDWSGRQLQNSSGDTVLNWNLATGESVLTTSSGIFAAPSQPVDLTITGENNILTVPAGKTFYLVSCQVAVTDDTGLSVPAQVKVDCPSGDMTAQTTLTGTTAGKVANILPLALTGVGCGSEDVVKLNVVVGATATTCTANVTVVGYYR